MPAENAFLPRYGPWAVITGASSGIGEAFAVHLAALGFNLVLTARREHLLNSLASKLSSAHSIQTKVITADLSTPTGWEPIEEGTKSLDVGLLINNAGVVLIGSFFHDPLDTHLNLIAVNVAAVTALAHIFGRRFADNGRGGIIFVSSIASRSSPWQATYSASKAFVTSLSIVLREELKPKGVNVLALEPGLTDTPMADAVNKTVNFAKAGEERSSVKQCVEEAMEQLEKGATKWTSGFKRRVKLFLLGLLPQWLELKIVSTVVKSIMDEKLLEYEGRN